jgi:hypothetical protein
VVDVLLLTMQLCILVALGAARIWGAAERLGEGIGSPLPQNDRPRYDQRVVAARAALNDDTAFDHAWHAGRGFPAEQAIEIALEATVERP